MTASLSPVVVAVTVEATSTRRCAECLTHPGIKLVIPRIAVATALDIVVALVAAVTVSEEDLAGGPRRSILTTQDSFSAEMLLKTIGQRCVESLIIVDVDAEAVYGTTSPGLAYNSLLEQVQFIILALPSGWCLSEVVHYFGRESGEREHRTG